MTWSTPTDAAAANEATTKPLHGGVPPKLAHLPEGARLDRYIVLEHLGSGGMGAVYRVHDAKLKREVALKLVLFDERHDDAGVHDRLLAEARAMAKVTHPHVLPIHDVELFDDAVCIAMEYVDGTTFERWLEEGRRSWRDILDTVSRAGRGLAAAHAAGLVHGDFKPHNILVGRDGRVRVTDFGLARAIDDDSDDNDTSCHDPDEPPRTRWPATTHVAYGTPQYMAPERHHGHLGDTRSDQYSFCVTLFEALHGRFPDAVRQHEPADQPEKDDAPRRDDVPVWLDRVLARGLDRDPTRRWPTMSALLDALENSPTTARRRFALTTALVAGVAALSLLVPEHQTTSTPDPTAAEATDTSTHAQLHARLRDAQRLEAAAKVDDAKTMLAALQLDARAAANPELELRARLEQAEIARYLDVLAARDAFEAAYFDAIAHDRPALALRAAVAAMALQPDAHPPNAGSAWSRHAEAAARLAHRRGHTDRPEAALLQARLALAAAWRGDDTTAVLREAEAVAAVDRIDDGRARGRVLAEAAESARVRGDLERARELQRRAWVVTAGEVVISHPQLVELELDGIGDALAIGDVPTARARLDSFAYVDTKALPLADARRRLLSGLVNDAAGDAMADLHAAARSLHDHHAAPDLRAAAWHALARAELAAGHTDDARHSIDHAQAALTDRYATTSDADSAPRPVRNTPSSTLLVWRYDEAAARAILAADRAMVDAASSSTSAVDPLALRQARARLVALELVGPIAHLDAWLADRQLVLQPRLASRPRPAGPQWIRTSSTDLLSETPEPAVIDDRVAR